MATFFDDLSRLLILIVSGLIVYAIWTGRLARSRKVEEQDRDKTITQKRTALQQRIAEAERYLAERDS